MLTGQSSPTVLIGLNIILGLSGPVYLVGGKTGQGKVCKVVNCEADNLITSLILFCFLPSYLQSVYVVFSL
jgi:hypothetical protein